MTVDTACSSGLVAAELSISKLLLSQVSMAVAAGVSALCNPQLFVFFSKAGMLAKDGTCKSFVASANGYERGEGCGAVVVAPPPAPADAFAIFGGAAVNQDGRSASMTAPNGPSQQAVLLSACRHAALRPDHIKLSECHGTGTALGDPIELGALLYVLTASQPEHALTLATAKTNVGHSEWASGILGMIKCILLVTEAKSPPNLHLSKLNPHIDREGYPFIIPTETIGQESAQFAGVSAFGFGGTNAHALVCSRRRPRPLPQAPGR
jgi:acyl transferase domain-containing protein